MKAVIMTANEHDAKRVFTPEVLEILGKRYELNDDLICKKNLENHKAFLKETEYIFCTWGMERFTKEEIKQYFPSLKCVFYAAGSVQHFAKEFLDCGVRVFSAWQANAVPVAEYTYAQIILAAKGFYNAERKSRSGFMSANRFSNNCGGMYNIKVGIIGVGSIGSMVAEKLKANDVDVLYYDPFLPAKRANALGIKKAELEEIFTDCDVITNHLANKDELTGVLSAELFAKMKPFATFINTGRGRQVDEKGLAKAMKRVKTRTALLDVAVKEPLSPFNPLYRLKNVIYTAHIAGSLGNEVVRMAQYMVDEAQRVDSGEKALYEVTPTMLSTMA